MLATVLACWLGSGIIFGFAALKPVLVAQGVYRNLCAAEELDGELDTCYEQELRWVLRSDKLGYADSIF